jgi:CTP synthase
MVERMRHPRHEVEIAVVGKYVAAPDAYLSVVEALTHGGAAHDTRVKIRWVPSEDLEHQPADRVLDGVDGILVPGGFGSRGVEGMVVAARYARERKIPYFGICLGMQVAVIEIARNVCGLEGANSSEFDPDTPHPVVDLMPDQADVDNLGGTMRLGLYPCVLEEGSLSRELYGEAVVYERHRHRFELNNAYRSVLADAGLRFVGASPDGRLVEMVELPDHPWFIGCQFHPEWRSRPNRPHPLYRGFVGAALAFREARQLEGSGKPLADRLGLR